MFFKSKNIAKLSVSFGAAGHDLLFFSAKATRTEESRRWASWDQQPCYSKRLQPCTDMWMRGGVEIIQMEGARGN